MKRIRMSDVREGDVLIEDVHVRLVTKTGYNEEQMFFYECRNLTFDARWERCTTTASSLLEGELVRAP